MKTKNLKEKLLKESSEFRKEYFKEDLAFGISRLIANLRTHEGLDQSRLAEITGTKQSGVSRIEKGSHLPSLSSLQKIAYSLDYKIRISFYSVGDGSVFDSDGGVSQPQIDVSITHVAPFERSFSWEYIKGCQSLAIA